MTKNVIISTYFFLDLQQNQKRFIYINLLKIIVDNYENKVYNIYVK